MIIKNTMIISYHKDRYNNYIEERIDKNRLTKSEKDLRRKIRLIIEENEKKMIEEDKYNRTHICEFCYMVKSKSGTCGCN